MVVKILSSSRLLMAHSTKVSILCRVDHWWFLGEVDGARGLVPAHCVQVGGLLHLVVHGHRGGGDVDTGQPFWQLSFRQWCHRQMFRCWGTTPLCDFWGDISFSKIGASWSGSVCRGIYAKYKYMHLLYYSFSKIEKSMVFVVLENY